MLKIPMILLLVLGSSSADDTCPDLPVCFCNKDKTSVNCDGKHLTSLPENLPITVEKLYLRYNQLSCLNTSAFGILSKLEELYLSNNKISIIQPFAFGNLTSLSYIDLRNNKITAIEKDAFSNVENLDTLYLETNHILSVHEEAFVGSEMLTYINLQSNRLVSVPSLGYMPNLKKLILEGNQITNATIPSSFNTSTKLSEITLSLNFIASLENETFTAIANNTISSLYLSRNKLMQIQPGAFAPLASIASLKLGTNPLDGNTLKSAMFSLRGKNLVSLDISEIRLNGALNEGTFAPLKNTSVTTLNMRFNKLSVLPDRAFFGLDKLLHLDLSNCEIQQTTAAAFDGLDRLTILILNKNKLMEVPGKLPPSLVNLYLSDNEFTAITDKSFVNLASLQELRISFNKIQTLEQDSFQGLVQLNKLNLYNNYIATLPGQVFEPLVRLVSLDLGKNNLVSIQNAKGRFGALSALTYLNLADNNLVYFQPDLFRFTIALKYLHLERNNLGDMISRDYGGAWLKGLVNLRSLYLMENNIKVLPDLTFQDLKSLALLNLTNNKLTGWGMNLFKAIEGLQSLDLSFNLISTLTEGNVADFGSMTHLNLTGNPFACNCDLRWFRDWMNKTSTVLANNASYHCAGPDKWAGIHLLSFDRTKINCLFFTWWQILIACCVVVVIVIVVSIILYRRRWWIKLSLYKLTRRSRRKNVAKDGRGAYGAINDLENEQGFDAYISCAEEDKQWVLRHLLPGVDKGELDVENKFGGHYSLFFEDRDAEPGHSKTGNIYENMTCSRKVIVVLSRHYLNSSLHVWEFELAIWLMYGHELEEIVVIDIGKGLPCKKIPKHLAHTMKRNKIVEWKEEPDAQQVFKNTINEILSKHSKAADMDAE